MRKTKEPTIRVKEFKPKIHELVPELANLTDEDLEELTDRNKDYDD